MNVTFLMRHPLYVRLYELPLREMAAQGHHVRLVFRRLEKDVETSLLEELTATYPNVVTEEADGRYGWWWPLTDINRAIRDYVRYHRTEYSSATALRARARRQLPDPLADYLDRRGWLRRAWMRRLFDLLCRALERLIPPDPSSRRKIERWRPDVILVTPMVDFAYVQTEFIKAGRALGVPTVLAVASWDNLSNKGLVHIQPDRVIVWNEIQRDEAVRLHGLERDRVVCTGAQAFDQWFGMQPGTDRAAFCAQAGGLDPDKPILLYLCSSIFICRDEVSFVREWLAAVRGCDQDAIRTANVLIRPHPSNVHQWRDVGFDDPHVVVWPRGGAHVVDGTRKQAYFDSLFHAAAVVGINTSGFIEAGIVGRRTFTLATDHFAETQEGTLHFHYLVEGGLLTKAETFDVHLEQLKEAFDDPRKAQQGVRAFVRDFVRPHGLEEPATPKVVQAMLSAAELKSIGWRSLPAARILRPLARRLLAGLREQQLRSRRANAWYDMELVTRAQALRARRTTAPVDGTAALTFEEDSLGRQLIAAAKAKGQILVTAWNGPPELEALYFIPFLRWMRQLCNLEPDRLTVLSRNLPQAWFADITPNVVAVPRKVVPDEEQRYARRKTSAAISQTVEARAVENIVELYRDGIIGMANWLDHARYVVRPRSLGTSFSESILIDQNGVPAAALERAVAALRERGMTVRTTGRGPKEASADGAPGCVSPEEIPEAVRSATAVIGPLGPAIAAAVQCGAPAHVLAQPGRAAALDYAVLAQMAQEAGGPIYRYEVAAFEAAVELATRAHGAALGQPQFA